MAERPEVQQVAYRSILRTKGQQSVVYHGVYGGTAVGIPRGARQDCLWCTAVQQCTAGLSLAYGSVQQCTAGLSLVSVYGSVQQCTAGLS